MSYNWGIYFLVKDKKVIYIGQTMNLKSRLSVHKVKDYDSVRYIPCDEDSVDDYEMRWIRRFKPTFNKRGVVPNINKGRRLVKEKALA